MVLRIKEAQVQFFNMTQNQPDRAYSQKRYLVFVKHPPKLVYMSEILAESSGHPEQPGRSTELMSSTPIYNKNPL